MNRILLADPNPTLRSALALLLETRLDAQIVGQVSSMESLLCEATAIWPDIIILDGELLGEPAQKRLSTLRQRAPRAALVVSSARPETTNLAADADAFLSKTDPPEVVLVVIRSLIQRMAQTSSQP